MAFSLVGSASTYGTSAGIDTTGANLLVAFAAGYGVSPTISDSKGNTWTALTEQLGSTAAARLFYCANPTVGAGHTFTLTGTTNSLYVEAWSGAASSAPFDVQNGAASASGAYSIATGSVTPSQGNELIVTGVNGYLDSSFSIDSGFTISNWLYDGTHMAGAMAHLVQGGAAAVNPTWTMNNNWWCAACIATFKGVAAAGGGVRIGVGT